MIILLVQYWQCFGPTPVEIARAEDYRLRQCPRKACTKKLPTKSGTMSAPSCFIVSKQSLNINSPKRLSIDWQYFEPTPAGIAHDEDYRLRQCPRKACTKKLPTKSVTLSTVSSYHQLVK